MNTVVVVARNNLSLTRQTVKATLAQDIPVDVLIVDNASSDGTYQWARALEAKMPNVYCVTYGRQVSLAACWNAGLKMVWARGGFHVLVLNNDVIVHPKTYGTLLEHGGMFVTTVSVDDEKQFHFDTAAHDRLYADPEHDLCMKDRPHPNFSGFLIHKACWDRVGPFNQNYYPAYCEDSDYHVRMHRAGISAVCIDLPMLHIGNGANTLKMADPAEAVTIRRGAERNREMFKAAYGCKPGEPAYESLFY